MGRNPVVDALVAATQDTDARIAYIGQLMDDAETLRGGPHREQPDSFERVADAFTRIYWHRVLHDRTATFPSQHHDPLKN